jgi:hypothetical protein
MFVLVVIPGFLFKRFYYFSEFSKEFSTKETVYKSIFYSIIPGVLIQLFCLLVYTTIRDSGITNSMSLTILSELFDNPKNHSYVTTQFLENDIYLFLYHQVIVFVMAIFIGWGFARLIRGFKLDVKYKLFRYKNQWYYIFSGEIRSFRKFKKLPKGISIDYQLNNDNEFQYCPPRADILVEEGGNSKLYTGYVVDYDLSHEDIGLLDRIYLVRAKRYKLSDDPSNKSRVETKIPGDVFILDGKNINNINLTYIPQELIKQEEIKQDYLPKAPDKSNWKILLTILFYLSFLTGFVILFSIFYITKSMLPDCLGWIVELNFVEKLTFSSVINAGVSLLFPFLESNEITSDHRTSEVIGYSKQQFLSKLILLVFVTLIFGFICVLSWLFF